MAVWGIARGWDASAWWSDTPAPAAVTAHISSLPLLEALSQFTFALPDQLAMLHYGASLQEIDTHTRERFARKAEDLRRHGLVRFVHWHCKVPLLRQERVLYRLSERGRDTAARTESVPVRRTLVAIERNAAEHGWATEEDVWVEAYPGHRSAATVRYQIRQFEQQRWVESRIFPAAGRLRIVALSPRGWIYVAKLRRQHGLPMLPLPPSPRQDQITHHLLTVHAALYVLRNTGGTLLGYSNDESLRSEQRKGRKTQRGDELGALPDGRLTYRLPDGRLGRAEIEVLSSKYTDQMLVDKHAALGPGTTFFAMTRRLADRVERLTAHRPILL